MDNLTDLVLALNPTEKQHFKKRHNPARDFVMLFDYINKRKSCVNAEVLAYLSQNKKDSKKITSSYLSVVKAYLKNRILESLRIQYIHKRKNYELLSRSMNTDILLEKGLYSLAKMEMETANAKNMDSSFPIERLLLLRRKSILNYFENYSKISLEEIEELHESRLETAEQLILEIKFARILSIMSYQYFNGLNDPDLLKSFMAEPYMQDESLSTDFSTKYLFHWVHAQFQEFKNNSEEALIHFNKSIKIWLEHPNYIKAHPRMYLGACFTYFKYLIHQNDPFTNLLTDINFDVLISKIDAENLSTEEKEKHLFLFNLFEILSLRQKGEFKEMVLHVDQIMKNNDYNNDVPDYEMVIFCYYSALAYFDNEGYRNAENILFDFLNPLDKRLASNPVYINVYILLHVMILLELKNEKHLRQLLPRYKKYLSQEKKLANFEVHFLNMASQLISSRFKATPDLVFQRFHKRLTHSLASNQRSIKMEYDYLINWVAGKMYE